MDFMETDLIKNLDKIHTTELGAQRIRKNLSLDTLDLIAWSKNRVEKCRQYKQKRKELVCECCRMHFNY